MYPLIPYKRTKCKVSHYADIACNNSNMSTVGAGVCWLDASGDWPRRLMREVINLDLHL